MTRCSISHATTARHFYQQGHENRRISQKRNRQFKSSSAGSWRVSACKINEGLIFTITEGQFDMLAPLVRGHAFGGIRSCRTRGRPARATAPAPTAELRHTPAKPAPWRSIPARLCCRFLVWQYGATRLSVSEAFARHLHGDGHLLRDWALHLSALSKGAQGSNPSQHMCNNDTLVATQRTVQKFAWQGVCGHWRHEPAAQVTPGCGLRKVGQPPFLPALYR